MKTSFVSRMGIFLIIAVFMPGFLFSQTGFGPTDSLKITDRDLLHFCGITPDYVNQSNLFAHGQGGQQTQYTFIYNDPCNISQACSRINMSGNGKFKVYFEDINMNTNDGFDDPLLGNDRINTFLAVLDYIESVMNIQVASSTDYIEIYAERSLAAPLNPATITDTYLANAGPYYPAGTFGVTQGYFDGDFFTHATTGVDPETCQYDAHVLVNFDSYYSATSSSFVPITYWNNFNITTTTCSIDLYSVILHEVTHAMGWLSAVRENSSFLAQCGNTANSYTRYDHLFNWYGTPVTPSGFVQVVDPSGPVISTVVNSNLNPLRSDMIWLNQFGPPTNQPVYAGVVDTRYNFVPGSFMSHLNANTLSFTGMSQISPGYQANYVMGPVISNAQRKREWTIPEMRGLLTLGYSLNPAFASAATLNPYNNTDQNGSILINNTSPYRTNPGTPMLAYNTPYNFMELMTTDHTMSNANVPNLTPTSFWTTTIGALTNVNDLEQVTQLFIMPNTLFGIRGVSDGGNLTGANNHNCVVPTANGDGFTYTPIPGFHGRAQFGFYLWDGHERGALRIVSIDVTPGSNYTVTPGNQLIVYPDMEDGTEMRQRILNPTFENTQIQDWQYESVFAGQNFSGGHSFNYVTNWWNLASGDVAENIWYDCFMGTITSNGSYGTPVNDWNPQNYGGFLYPTPVTGNNQRYHNFQGAHNYSVLTNQVTGCNVYHFECDLNFEKTNFTVGQTFQFQLQFVDNPFPGYHTQLYYTAPVQVTITSVAPDSWQHVTFDFQYCGTPTYYMNLLVQGIVAPTVVVTGTGGSPLGNTFTAAQYSVVHCPFIDNISLKQIPTPPPLTLAVTANPSTVCYGSTSNLSAVSSPFLPCNATYSWSPATTSLNQSNTLAQTGAVTSTTTYTATINYSCNQTASGTVTVTPSALPVITPMGPYCNNDNVSHPLSATPTGGVFAGPGVSHTFSGYFFNAFSAGAGTHNITYTYIPFAGCTTVVSINIIVNAPPTIAFGTNGPYCSTSGLQSLSVTPAGGTWTGTGIVSNQFNPGVGAGNYTLTYTVVSGPCTAVSTTTVTVVAPSVVSITPIGPLCSNDPATALSGSPAGGVFTGTGVTLVSGTYYFNPSTTGTGTFTVTYSVSGTCPGSTNAQIIVIPGNIHNWPKFITSTTGTDVRSEGFGIVNDGNGNIYVTGQVIAINPAQGKFTGSSTTFPTSGKDIFVAKFSDNCGLQWYKIFGGTGDDAGNDIALDASGNVFVTGQVVGSFTFATGYPVSLPTGASAAFIAKLNPANGTVTGFNYSATSVLSAFASGQSITVNQTNGDVYVQGIFNSNITFAPLAVLSPNTAGNRDVFAVRYNNALTSAAWNVKIYSTGIDAAGGIALDNSGNVYIGSTVIGAGVANSTTFNTSGTTGSHPFIVKYNSSNTFVAAKIMGTNGNNAYLRDLVCDVSGKVYFCGSYTGPITFFTPYTTTAGDYQIYVTRIDPSLTFNSACWTITAGSTTSSVEDARGITVDATNGIYFTGYAANNCPFPGFTPSSITGSPATSEAFVARILPTGVASSLVFTVSSTAGAGNIGSAICTNTSGTQYSTGRTQESTTFGSLGTFSSTGYEFFAARELNAGSFYRYGEDTDTPSDQSSNDPATDDISAYPNPTNGLVTLVFNNENQAKSEIVITDIWGRLVDAKLYPSSADNVMTLDLSACENGVYVIIVKNADKQYAKRIVLQR